MRGYKSFVWWSFLFIAIALRAATAQEQSANGIELLITGIVSQVDVMSELVNSTKDPIQAYLLLNDLENLTESAAVLVTLIDRSLEKNEELAESFSQKAEEFREDPQKVRLFKTKSAELLEQIDLLFIGKRNLANALENLQEQTRQIKEDSIVTQLIEIESGLYESEIEQFTSRLNTAYELTKETNPKEQQLQEWQTLLTHAQSLAEALEARIEQDENFGSTCEDKAKEESSEQERLRRYMETCAKFGRQADRLLILKGRLNDAAESLNEGIKHTMQKE